MSLVVQIDPNNARDIVLHPFTLWVPGVVTIRSWGHGDSAGAPGGTNAQGVAIAGGGLVVGLGRFSVTGTPTVSGNCVLAGYLIDRP